MTICLYSDNLQTDKIQKETDMKMSKRIGSKELLDKIGKFEDRLSKLNQSEVLILSANALSKLLVDKGLVTVPEIQAYFLKELEFKFKKNKNGKEGGG